MTEMEDMGLLPRRQPERADFPAAPTDIRPPQLRTPRPAAWWIVPITLLVGGVVGGLAWLLPAAGWAAAEASARQGAIQTALAAGAGVGAAVTLMLAFRRQRHQEHAAHVTAYLGQFNADLAKEVAAHTKHDATERRVTELYIKAVEQLGSDQAAVRLGGLYALERLAQDNPGHRQTIVNVICAYLRVDYTDPGPVSSAKPAADAVTAAVQPGTHPAATGDVSDQRGERHVRLTAQSILTAHIRDDRWGYERETSPADEGLWAEMNIDLSGPTLINLDFFRCHVADARSVGKLLRGRKAGRATERREVHGSLARRTQCGRSDACE